MEKEAHVVTYYLDIVWLLQMTWWQTGGISFPILSLKQFSPFTNVWIMSCVTFTVMWLSWSLCNSLDVMPSCSLNVSEGFSLLYWVPWNALSLAVEKLFTQGPPKGFCLFPGFAWYQEGCSEHPSFSAEYSVCLTTPQKVWIWSLRMSSLYIVVMATSLAPAMLVCHHCLLSV